MSTELKHPQLQQLNLDVDKTLKAGQPLSVLAARFRNLHAQLAQLPPAFGPALENILQRVEAGALFTEESCSFSQSDLAAALQVWLQKADARLG